MEVYIFMDIFSFTCSFVEFNQCEPSSKESELYAEATHLEAADVHASPINNKMHSSPLEFSQHDAKPSVGAEKLTSAGTSGVVSTFKPEPEPPGVYSTNN